MYRVSAFIIGSRKARCWDFPEHPDADRMVKEILRDGFSELEGPEDCPVKRVY